MTLANVFFGGFTRVLDEYRCLDKEVFWGNVIDLPSFGIQNCRFNLANEMAKEMYLDPVKDMYYPFPLSWYNLGFFNKFS